MKRKCSKGARLPRLTMLAMSAKELQRFSLAAEQICSAAHELTEAIEQLRFQVDRLVKRSEAARKANATRNNGRPPDTAAPAPAAP